MAKFVNTVTGTISPDDIGVALMHEHICYGYPGWYANTIQVETKEEILDNALKAMADIKECGVKTYVDATPNDSGRKPLLYREISEKSGINIICSTGLYTDAQGASYFKFWGGLRDLVEMLENLYTTEIEVGIGDTGVKAGVIKVASGQGVITDYEKSVITAAGKSQKKTGVPVITHTEAGTMGVEQAEMMIKAGANPKQLSIGHAGGSADLKYHQKILEQGVFLSFDRLGLNADLWSAGPDKFRIASIVGLIQMGYADQLILSHDVVLTFLGGPLELDEETAGDWYPTHLFKNVIPILKKAGVTDEQIHTITVKNPKRLFEG